MIQCFKDSMQHGSTAAVDQGINVPVTASNTDSLGQGIKATACITVPLFPRPLVTWAPWLHETGGKDDRADLPHLVAAPLC